VYKRILIPIDGSPSSEHALAWGIGFAKTLHAEVAFLHVVENPISRVYGLPGGASYVNDMLQDLKVASRTALDNAETRAREAGVSCEALMLEDDHPAMTILHKEKNYDLTIMGTHSRKGLDRLFLGSVTEAVLRHSDKPHLILHSPDTDVPRLATDDQASIKQILLPIADAAASDSAIEEGLYLAQALHAKVTFLHVLEVPVTVYTMPESMVYEPSIREDLKNAAQETLKKAQNRASELGVESEARVVNSANTRAVTAILEAEVTFDLTVMATHSRRGIRRALLGSVTEGVLRQSSRPHLVVRCRE
jgi:nucleotide-binding universal stress UspA family protein